MSQPLLLPGYLLAHTCPFAFPTLLGKRNVHRCAHEVWPFVHVKTEEIVGCIYTSFALGKKYVQLQHQAATNDKIMKQGPSHFKD